jgi:hypothetical protein
MEKSNQRFVVKLFFLKGLGAKAIHSVLSNLTGDTLRAIFAKWIERLNWVALNEGHYYR